jgi:hypothetical protein
MNFPKPGINRHAETKIPQNMTSIFTENLKILDSTRLTAQTKIVYLSSFFPST